MTVFYSKTNQKALLFYHCASVLKRIQCLWQIEAKQLRYKKVLDLVIATRLIINRQNVQQGFNQIFTNQHMINISTVALTTRINAM